MSNSGTLLLSKVIDDNDVQALALHNVRSEHFVSDADRKAYEFIKSYAAVNNGQAPSYATVIENVSDFYYITDVSDSYAWLTKKLLNDAGKAYVHAFLTQSHGVQELWSEYQNDIPTLVAKMQEKLDEIKQGTDTREKVGADIKNDFASYLEEYDRRKSGESFKTWKSKFSHIGEYTSGNMYVIYGKSGRGKSVIAMEEAVEAATQGANVLIWSMEMPRFEIMTRIYVALSGRQGLTMVSLNGIDMNAGFDSDAVRKGKLSEDFEVAYKAFLANLNETLKGSITVRAVDDYDFNVRNVAQLQSDILRTKSDFVLIDPMYYMDYEKNTSGTKGGDAAATSMKLRRLAGTMKVVLLAITQAEEKESNKNEDDSRELALPERKDVAKTKQLLQDAYLLIGVDTDYKQSRGLVGIDKGRDGGEGDFVEIVYAPQVGVVYEPKADISQFNF